MLPLAAERSQFVLMCFENKIPGEEVRRRFGKSYEIEMVASKGETGTRRTINTYLMNKVTQSR